MTLQTSGINVDRPREIKRSARWGIPLSRDLAGLGVIAEFLDQVGFPVGSPVSEVGWIERGFLVGVLRMLLPQFQEILGRGIERHALGQEFGFHPRIAAAAGSPRWCRCGWRARCPTSRPASRMTLELRILLEQRSASITQRNSGEEERCPQDEIDSNQQAHVMPVAGDAAGLGGSSPDVLPV